MLAIAAVAAAAVLIAVVGARANGPAVAAGPAAAGGTVTVAPLGSTAPRPEEAVSDAATSTSTTDDTVDSAEPTEPWPPPPADPTSAVSAAVSDAVDLGVQESVVIMDRTTGSVLVRQDADRPFPALSLVKLMIAADVLDGSGGADLASGSDVPSSDGAAGSGTAGGSDASGTSDATGTSDAAGSSDAVAGPAGSGDPGTGDPEVPVTPSLLKEMISRSDDVTAQDLYDQTGGDQMVDRVVARYGLTGSSPTPDGQYWGNVQTTAADMASLLNQLLADPNTASVIGPAMLATSATAADGVDQRIGMRVVPGAGSKQGWGCCLSGIVGIHSVGFTPERIVVVLSSAAPDDDQLGDEDGLALQADPGAQVSIAAVTATVRAALGGPAA